MANFAQRIFTHRTAQIMFLLNALIWLLIGMASWWRASGVMAWVIVVLMLGNVGAMLFAAWGLSKQQKFFFYAALFILLINIFLTLTDEFGLIDLLTLVFDLILLAILIGLKAVKNQSPN